MAQKDFLDKSGLTYLWSKLKGKLATKADLVDGKIATSQLPSSIGGIQKLYMHFITVVIRGGPGKAFFLTVVSSVSDPITDLSGLNNLIYYKGSTIRIPASGLYNTSATITALEWNGNISDSYLITDSNTTAAALGSIASYFAITDSVTQIQTDLTSDNTESTATSTSSMPIIRLVRIFDTQSSMYFDALDNTLKIKVEVLAGKLQTGDQIVLCQRKRSYSEKKGSMEHRWQSMIYKTITDSEIANNRYVTLELTPADMDDINWLLYRTNTCRGGALRCVRIRRGYSIYGDSETNNKCLVSNAATFTARKNINGCFVFDF